VLLTDKQGHVSYGTAQLHPDDHPYASQFTGLHIAESRAELDAIKQIIQELKIELKAYNKLYFAINKSKHFSPKHYEAKMLLRKINQTEEDIKYFNYLKDLNKKDLQTYLEGKQKLHSTGQK